MDAVSNVARYLLTVRAEYFFLAVLHFSVPKNHSRVEKEQLEFTRFVNICICIYTWYQYIYGPGTKSRLLERPETFLAP